MWEPKTKAETCGLANPVAWTVLADQPDHGDHQITRFFLA
jgi:hypothetical protein